MKSRLKLLVNWYKERILEDSFTRFHYILFIIFLLLAWSIVHDMSLKFISPTILQYTISSVIFYFTTALLQITGLLQNFSVLYYPKQIETGEVFPHVELWLSDGILISSGTLASACLGVGTLCASLFLFVGYLIISRVNYQISVEKGVKYSTRTILIFILGLILLHLLLMILRFYLIVMLTYLFNQLSRSPEGYRLFMIIYEPFKASKPYNKTPAMFIAHDVIANIMFPFIFLFIQYCCITHGAPKIQDFISKKLGKHRQNLE